MRFPANLRYTKDHEWVRSESDGQFTIGITDFAQRELSDIVFVELPSVDDTFAEGDEFGTVEAVKTVSSLYMPLAGTVVAINTDLNDDPSVVNNA
ncbi:MAG TPA: glycine cleavage system protein GcvH, partial [Bacteroidetes bacterium]|nr:glycine cleavage system protein GcvH [Bacteroidota bacterium]